MKTRYSGDLNTKLFEVWNSNEQLCATKKSTVVGHRKGFWIAENLEWFFKADVDLFSDNPFGRSAAQAGEPAIFMSHVQYQPFEC